MAKEPAARFATPTEVAAALTPFATGSDLAGLLATSLLPRSRRCARSASTGILATVVAQAVNSDCRRDGSDRRSAGHLHLH